MDSLRTIMARATARNQVMKTADHVTAFLHAPLPDDMERYMKIPPGAPQQEGEEQMVCRMLKCVNGLPESPRLYHEYFNIKINTLGMKRSDADPCVYRSTDEAATITTTMFCKCTSRAACA